MGWVLHIIILTYCLWRLLLAAAAAVFVGVVAAAAAAVFVVAHREPLPGISAAHTAAGNTHCTRHVAAGPRIAAGSVRARPSAPRWGAPAASRARPAFRRFLVANTETLPACARARQQHRLVFVNRPPSSLAVPAPFPCPGPLSTSRPGQGSQGIFPVPVAHLPEQENERPVPSGCASSLSCTTRKMRDRTLSDGTGAPRARAVSESARAFANGRRGKYNAL